MIHHRRSDMCIDLQTKSAVAVLSSVSWSTCDASDEEKRRHRGSGFVSLIRSTSTAVKSASSAKRRLIFSLDKCQISVITNTSSRLSSINSQTALALFERDRTFNQPTNYQSSMSNAVQIIGTLLVDICVHAFADRRG